MNETAVKNRRIIITLLLCFVFSLVLIAHTNHAITRKLSQSNDIFTNESVRTINGTIPEVSCPVGFFYFYFLYATTTEYA